jgi:O-antigen/teichoic acid export membrane protein
LEAQVMSQPLAQRVATGALLMVVLRAAVRLVGVASILILARVLQPDDFGLVTLAFVSVSILENLSEPLLQPFLVRAKQVDDELYNTAWTLGLLRAIAIGALIALSAPFVAALMNEPRLVPLMSAFAFAAVLQGLENVGMTSHVRALNYDAIVKWRFTSKLTATLTTIPLAVLTHSYWALVAGIIAGRIASVISSYWLSRYRPHLRLSGAGKMMHFAKWMFGYGLLDTIESYLMTVMLGRMSGPSAVGTFNIAYTLAAMPCSEIGAPVREPLYVGLAAAKDQAYGLTHKYLSGLALLTMVLLPMSVGIALTAHLIVPLALGPSWSSATTLVRICALYAFLDALTSYTINLFIVLDRLRTLVLTFALLLALRVPAAIVGFVLDGVDGAALGLLVAAFFGALVWHALAARLIAVRALTMAASVWRSAAAALAMSLVLLALMPQWTLDKPIPAMLAAAILGALTHIGTQSALWCITGRSDGAEQYCLTYIRGLWDRLTRPAARA